jgi:uncharacterized protein (DUF1697 family)
MASLKISQTSVLELEESALDTDQVENLIKFCPTKEEMEIIKVGIYIMMVHNSALFKYLNVHDESPLTNYLFIYLSWNRVIMGKRRN